jgi:predicted RND superfamily exporter protein
MADHFHFYADYSSTNQPKLVIISILIFTTVISIGIFSIVVNTDPINYCEEDQPVAVSATLIYKNLGGYFPVSIIFKGDIKDPVTLKKMMLNGFICRLYEKLDGL